jgi:uncharacterized protein (DUF779 family)
MRCCCVKTRAKTSRTTVHILQFDIKGVKKVKEKKNPAVFAALSYCCQSSSVCFSQSRLSAASLRSVQLDGIRSDNARVQSELRRAEEREQKNAFLSSIRSRVQRAGLQSQVAKIQQTRAKNGQKIRVAYLTYDDGPVEYHSGLCSTRSRPTACTPRFSWWAPPLRIILDVIKRAVAEGNVIGIHSWDA